MFFLNRVARWWRDFNRNIFVYHDGTRRRRADPLTIGLRLEQLCPTYEDMLRTLARPLEEAPAGGVRRDLEEQKKEAQETLVAVAMQVFDLKPLSDSGGVTQGEALLVLASYFAFMQALARDAELFPSSPAAE